MKARLAKRYAQAVFQAAAEQQNVPEVEAELAVVQQIFGEAAVQDFFDNPGVSTADKKAVISRTFSTYLSPFTQNFLCHMTEKRRINVLPDVINAYRDLVKESRNIVAVEVVTAAPLANEDQAELVTQLSVVTGKTIELSARVDKGILGGLIIQIGDKRIDNSVKAELTRMKNQMLSK